MNRTTLRILFLIPVIAIIFGIFSVFGNPSWPQPALDYLAWYQSQPFSQAALIANRIGLAGLCGLLISSVALLFFWAPARYIYLVSLLLALAGEFVDAPVLAGGLGTFLDNITKLFVGANVALIFTSPGAKYFRGSNEHA